MESGALAGAIIGGIILFILVVALLLFLFSRWMRGPMKGSNNPKSLTGKLVVITGNQRSTIARSNGIGIVISFLS